MGGGWKFAAASVVGTSHQKSPEGLCQDAHALAYLPHASAFLGVVSDGAGSASHAHVGSRLTCDIILREATEAAADLLTESFARDTVEKVRRALFDEADRLQLTIRDFACTMLVAIIAPEKAAFWQVGDGAICVRESGVIQYRCIYWPEKGDYANVTFFVTDLRAQEETQVTICDSASIIELAMFSDGIERLALDFVARQAHTGFFNGLFPHMSALPEGHSPELASMIEGFLSSDRVNKRTDDDKTLLLASRLSSSS